MDTSDALAVKILQRECHVKQPWRVVRKACWSRSCSICCGPSLLNTLVQKPINGQQEIMISYSDSESIMALSSQCRNFWKRRAHFSYYTASTTWYNPQITSCDISRWNNSAIFWGGAFVLQNNTTTKKRKNLLSIFQLYPSSSCQCPMYKNLSLNL